MLGIISAAGNALRAFGTVHPAIKWGVVVLAGLLAVELLGREGIELYARMATVQKDVAAKNVENQAKASTMPDSVVTCIVGPCPVKPKN